MTERTLTMLDALRGEFTQIPSASRLASPTSHNPLARAHYAMIRELARMQVPRIGTNDDPEDFEAVADYLLRVTPLFDRWLQAVGAEVKSNALCRIDENMFSEQFYGAISGNATHELDCAAEAAREVQDEGADADAAWDARDQS